MLKNITFAIVSLLVLGTASAAMARSAKVHNEQYYVCQTDDGYGRKLPCDMGGGD